MKQREFHLFVLLLLTAVGWCGLAQVAPALTVTVVTSDNGYPAHQVSWTDAAGLPRTAVLVDQTSTFPCTGYLRQYTYQVNGTTRICTGTYYYGGYGPSQPSGDGFVLNETANGTKTSTADGTFPGTTTIALQGASHAIITYSIPTYTIGTTVVPTTVQWFFADGRSHPIFSISQDATASTGNLNADSRSPYGDMAYDGASYSKPIFGAPVGGYSYGDQYKFVTLATGPEQVTRASPWQAIQANITPYTMQWIDPAVGDAEMGHVATIPISINDQGMDTQTGLANSPAYLFDPRNHTGTSLPPDTTQAYQIINESDTLAATGTTTSKRLAWGANFGRVGGDSYGLFGDITDYSQHSTMPLDEPTYGRRVSGAMTAYSVFVVLGQHLGNFLTGAVGQQVTDIDVLGGTDMIAFKGTVVTSGPAGVGNAATSTITYDPPGYDPIYSAWELFASGNSVDVLVEVGGALDHPIFVINNYTATQLPGAIYTGEYGSEGTAGVPGVDYFATLDTTNHRLWITVNQIVKSDIELVVMAPKSSQTIAAFSAIPNTTYGSAPLFVMAPLASSGLPVTLSILSGPAFLDGPLLVTTGVGAVTVAADQPGNSSYLAAPEVTTSFNVAQASQTITAFSSIASTTYGAGPFTLPPLTASSGLPVTLSVQSGPATISGNQVTITGAGTVVLAADQAGNANYLAAPEVTTSFNVAQASQTITPFAAIGSITYGIVPFTMPPPTASSGLPVTVTVKSGPATISGNQITITGAGTVVLAADQAGNANYLAAPEAIASFTVAQASQIIASFSPIASTTYGAAPFTITLPTASSGLPVSVTVKSGPATISGNQITVTGVGTVVLAADQAGNANYLAVTEVTAKFTVAQTSQIIAAFSPIASTTYGTAPFTITPPTASSGLPVAITVASGPATITGNQITVTGTGTVVLAADQAGNANYLAATEVTASFTVGQAAQTIGAFGTIPNLTYGVRPITFTLPTASSGLPVTVTVQSGPATISGNTVTVTGAGSIAIRAHQDGNADFAAAPSVLRGFTVVKASQSITFTPISNKSYGATPFRVTASASSGLGVTFHLVSGPASVVNNLVSITGLGTVVLAADQTGNANYNAAPEVTTSFIVSVGSQTITFPAIGHQSYPGAPITLGATASSGLSVTYRNTGPARISGNILTITGVGTVLVAASQGGNADYAAAPEVRQTFTVTAP